MTMTELRNCEEHRALAHSFGNFFSQVVSALHVHFLEQAKDNPTLVGSSYNRALELAAVYPTTINLYAIDSTPAETAKRLLEIHHPNPEPKS